MFGKTLAEKTNALGVLFVLTRSFVDGQYVILAFDWTNHQKTFTATSPEGIKSRGVLRTKNLTEARHVFAQL